MKRKILTLLFVFCMLLTNVTFVSVSAATSPVVIIEHDDFEDFTWSGTKWYRFGTKITQDGRYDLSTETDGNDSLKITTTGTSTTAVLNRIAQYSSTSIGSMHGGNSKLVISARLASNGTTCWSYPCEVGIAVNTNGNATDRKPLFSLAQTASGIKTGRFNGSSSTNIASSVLGTYSASQIKWHTFTAIADIANGTATWTYYVDGVKYTGNYTTDVSSVGYNTIYFGTWTLNKGTASGLFDDISVYSLPADAEFSILSSSVDSDNNIIVNFTEPVSDAIKSYIKIDGTLVDSNRITLLDSQLGVKIAPPGEGYESTPVSLTLAAGAKGLTGSASTEDYTTSVVVKATVIESAKFVIADENFDNWDFSDTSWHIVNSAFTAPSVGDFHDYETEDGNGYFKITAQNMQAIRRIGKKVNSADGVQEVLDNNIPHKWLIKERVAAGTSVDSIQVGEMGFSLGGGTKQTLATIYKLYYNDGVTARLHNASYDTIDTDSFPPYNKDEKTWYDIIAVGDVINGVGTWTYYVDGTKYKSESYTFNEASTDFDSIYFGTRGNGVGYIDDLGAYILTGKHDFEVETVTMDDNDDITIGFSHEIYKDNLVDSITINGKSIDADNVIVLNGQKSVKITADKYGYLPGTQYKLNISATASDVFGQTLAEAYQYSFTVEEDEPYKVYLKEKGTLADGNYSYSLYGYNNSGAEVPLKILFVTYVNENGVKKLHDVELADWTLANTTELQQLTENSFEADETNYDVECFIWDAQLQPAPINVSKITEPVSDELKLPSMVSDGAVLQRDAELPVWGKAAAGETITVTLGGNVKTAVADVDGNWTVTMPAISVSGNPYEMTVSTNRNEKLVITDLLAGDVWLCAGQSNMELPLSATDNAAQEAQSLNNSNLRYFYQTRLGSSNPKEDVANGQWKYSNSDSALPFSAVGHYFGKEIQEYLSEREETEVPVGLLSAHYGGSSMEAWASKEAIENSSFANYLDIVKYDDTNKNPTCLYNAMIAPMIPYAIKGVIWYQGESNNARYLKYLEMQNVMLEDWRSRWGYDFPFLMVQLAPYNGTNFEHLRQAQLEFVNATNGTEMAVIMDLGNETNIHPTSKQPVAHRLALAAMGTVYGDSSAQYKFPQPESITKTGSIVTVNYKDCYDGLKLASGTTELVGFEVAGSDGVFYAATATLVDGDTVEVVSENVTEPTKIRYGYKPYPNPVLNLYNSADFIATPFISEIN